MKIIQLVLLELNITNIEDINELTFNSNNANTITNVNNIYDFVRMGMNDGGIPIDNGNSPLVLTHTTNEKNEIIGLPSPIRLDVSKENGDMEKINQIKYILQNIKVVVLDFDLTFSDNHIRGHPFDGDGFKIYNILVTIYK